jgi:hypothetical protein
VFPGTMHCTLLKTANICTLNSCTRSFEVLVEHETAFCLPIEVI